MRKSTILVAALAAALVAGCATPPDRVKAAPISMARYAGWSCNALAAEGNKRLAQVEDLSVKQGVLAKRDASSVFWTGVPRSTLGGANAGVDHEADLALAKGHLAAIQDARAAKGC